MCEGADLTKLEMQVVKRVLMCPHTITICVLIIVIYMCPHTAMYAKRLPSNLVMQKRRTNAFNKETYFRYVFYVYTIHNIYIQFNYMDGEDFVFMKMETFDTETVYY